MNQILNSRTRSYRKISKTKGTRQPDQLLNQASWETGVSRATRPLADRTSLITGQPATVDTLEGVDLLMRQVTPKWCVSFVFCPRSASYFSFFPGSASNVAFVAGTQLCRSATRTNIPCDVRCVACHVQVAILLSYLGPPWCQWCSDWGALGCSAAVTFGCASSSHVSGWLMLVEVFPVFPLRVSCFLS